MVVRRVRVVRSCLMTIFEERARRRSRSNTINKTTIPFSHVSFMRQLHCAQHSCVLYMNDRRIYAQQRYTQHGSKHAQLCDDMTCHDMTASTKRSGHKDDHFPPTGGRPRQRKVAAASSPSSLARFSACCSSPAVCI